MNFVTRIFIGLLPITLVGCAYFSHSPIIQGRDKHYLSARSIRPARVLPGMKTDSFRNDYPIPDRNYPESAQVVSILPPGLKSTG
jgi:uncharacterized lipoprotein